ncbi:MAG TPA: SbcC/MukB-like Walker B domain-containing protein, partial [Marmoricola sp.]|nr:SbcC/MukB-like Walker B domain-containing protein [Marmoricola sp.]
AEATALGFSSGEDAASSVLDDATADALVHRERERQTIRLRASQLLEDPAVVGLTNSPRPDLNALQANATLAEDRRSKARAALQIADGRALRSRVIAKELESAIAHYRPLETKAAQVTALSGLLEGTSADNQLRMRLSAFVLAERLRQVIAAANARLQTISEGRYVLNYQEERGAGDNRGGLSLSVLDEWTGIRRDPTTLSGGETFVVSLCLALGLADTVADESGGLRIDTLFIDEGFGSLDSQTLDSVIDILGQLSQGGRVTGVVSHVQELRERLPAVLEVIPSKSGSTVRRAIA